MSTKSDEASHKHPLLDYPAFEPPASLYKFIKGEWGLEALKNRELKVTPPDEFNDPFEFAPGIDMNRVYTAAEIKGYLLDEGCMSREQLRTQYCGGDDELYRTWVDRVAQLPELFPTQLLSDRRAFTKAVSKIYGVICFSAFANQQIESAAVVRHWSSYADDHRGLVIEFNGAAETLCAIAKQQWLFPVIPERDRRWLSAQDLLGDYKLRLREWAEMKSAVWAEECEWRMIVPLRENHSFEGFRVRTRTSGERLLFFLDLRRIQDEPAKQTIRRVILGCRASTELEKSVTALLRQPGYEGISLARARECPSSYSMKYDEIGLGPRP